jgi:tol-pal system protein YbgF
MRLLFPMAWAWALALAGSLVSVGAHAQLFPDNEARKAIVELRQQLEALKTSTAEQAKQQAAADKELTEQLAQLRRSLLELNNQIESLKSDLAKQRGTNEQLARDLSDVQRRQKDIAQGVDDRIRKLEPQKVAVDGVEFLADAEEKRGFEEAFALFRGSDFVNAGNSFSAFLKRFPASGYTPSARFWLGNSLYAKRDLPGAVFVLRQFMNESPDHPKVPEALLAVANCQSEMKDTRAARATLNDLLKRFPQSEAALAGKERLASLK